MTYTCKDRRQEMILLGLKHQLEKTEDPEKRSQLEKEIHKIEKEMALD